MKGTIIRSIALISLIALGTACGVDLQFEHVAGPSGSNEVSPDLISVEQGTATAVRLLDGDEDLDEGTEIQVWTDAGSILGVDPTWDFDTFVFYGVSPGETNVFVSVDSEHVTTIHGVVVSPLDRAE